MKGLRKAAADTRHYGYDRGLKTVILYRMDTEEVMTDTIWESSYPEYCDGYLVCGACREPKTWKDIRKMVYEKLEMVEANEKYVPRVLPSNITADRCYKDHRAAYESWPHGEICEFWVDVDGYTCVRYTDGEWYHYGQSSISSEIVWW